MGSLVYPLAGNLGYAEPYRRQGEHMAYLRVIGDAWHFISLLEPFRKMEDTRDARIEARNLMAAAMNAQPNPREVLNALKVYEYAGVQYASDIHHELRDAMDRLESLDVDEVQEAYPLVVPGGDATGRQEVRDFLDLM
jgi:hypothetical protein